MSWEQYVQGLRFNLTMTLAGFIGLYSIIMPASSMSWDIALAFCANIVFYWAIIPSILILCFRSWEYRKAELERARQSH